MPASVDREDKAKLINRLNRIEGQVRGIGRMVGDDRYSLDVLTQIQAVRAALTRVESDLVSIQLKALAEEVFASGDKALQRQRASELMELLGRSLR